MKPVTRTDLPLRLLRRGKVRDVYEVDRDRVLLVATDRVSAFDVVMREPIPHKGAVLTQLTAWWLRHLEPDVAHHMISADIGEIVGQVPQLERDSSWIAGRTMLCRRAEVFPIECVIRGYLSGSAWKEYAEHGTLAGERLPDGLIQSQKLPAPIFSPATKAEEGHDENIPLSRMSEIVGPHVTSQLERLTRVVYASGADLASSRGIIIADTKLEFGYLANGGARAQRNRSDWLHVTGIDPSRVILVDEVLTPDSSRFWPADRFEAGRSQPSFDKQPLRDYLDAERRAGRWNGESPPPPLPHDVVAATSERYLDAYRRLTLSPLQTGAVE